jgi:hypothetical protein
MTEYVPIILNRGLNDVTYMVDGIITEVKWDVPIYFLRGNVYENIGSISEIRRRGTFNNNITDTNNVPIGTVDELRTNRLFIMRTIDNQTNEEKNTLSKLRGGKTLNKRRKSRKTVNKKRKTRKTKRRRQQ